MYKLFVQKTLSLAILSILGLSFFEIHCQIMTVFTHI